MIVKSLLLLAAVNEYEGGEGGLEFDADAAVAVKGTRFARPRAPSISMVIFNQFHVKRNAHGNSKAAAVI